MYKRQGQLYIGNTKRSVHARVDEHICYCCLMQPEMSAIVEHTLANADYHMLFEETRLLSSVSAYFRCLHMESVQIQKHASIAVNRWGESLSLSALWTRAVANQ